MDEKQTGFMEKKKKQNIMNDNNNNNNKHGGGVEEQEQEHGQGQGQAWFNGNDMELFSVVNNGNQGETFNHNNNKVSVFGGNSEVGSVNKAEIFNGYEALFGDDALAAGNVGHLGFGGAHCWCGEATCSSSGFGGVKGIQSLFGDTTNSVAGEGMNQVWDFGTLDSNNAGEDGFVNGCKSAAADSKDGVEVIDASVVEMNVEKRGRGRPKGSVNKEKKGPGRPKGSLNKKKKESLDDNIDPSCNNHEILDDFQGGEMSSHETLDGCAMDLNGKRRGRGRPKGSSLKKRKEDTSVAECKIGEEVTEMEGGELNTEGVIEEEPTEMEGGILSNTNKKKRGRPKGSVTKMKKEGTLVTECKIGEEPAEIKGGEVIADRKTEEEPTVVKAGELSNTNKKLAGRPKGSKNKKKIVGPGEVENESGMFELEEKRLIPDETHRSICLGFPSSNVVDDEVKNVFSTTVASGGDGKRCENPELMKKRGRGRPKGAKTKNKIVSSDEERGICNEIVSGNDDIVRPKKKRGRKPKEGAVDRRFKKKAILVGQVFKRIFMEKNIIQTSLPKIETLGEEMNRKELKTDSKILQKSRQLKARKDINRRKLRRGMMCHQCMRSDRGGVLCLNCKRKRYCFDCLSKWYPDKTKEAIEAACPYCQGTCNCRKCLKEDVFVINGDEKVDTHGRTQKLLFLLHKILPLLRQIQQEQKSELNIEISTSGCQLTQDDVLRLELEDDDRVYCNNCNTSVANFLRSCSNCSFDLCITCCRQMREASQFGHFNTETSHLNIVQSSDNQVKESGEVNPVHDPATNISWNFSDWRAEADGKIPCPSEAHGGCGIGTLELRQVFEPNWVEQLIQSAEKLLINFQPINVDFSHGCPVCPTCSPDSKVRQSAFRENSCDNFLYCPSATELGDYENEHFQMHWVKGEPVIVRNVLEKSSGLSWEPLVIWRAFRGAEKILKEAAHRVKAIDCLHWSQKALQVNILTHVSEVKIPPWQCNIVEKLQKQCENEDLQGCCTGSSKMIHGIKLRPSRTKGLTKRDSTMITDIEVEDNKSFSIDDIDAGSNCPDINGNQLDSENDIKCEISEIDLCDQESDDSSKESELVDEKKHLQATCVEPWTFEQHLGEAVFIPAGCPHQVRNRQSCIKVALDFVSPDNIEECVRLTEEFRKLPKNHQAKEDKLEIKKMALYAASLAVNEAESLMSKT
ncbi:hypothetical protein ACFE04_010366 [Oxalis oulophora]